MRKLTGRLKYQPSICLASGGDGDPWIGAAPTFEQVEDWPSQRGEKDIVVESGKPLNFPVPRKASEIKTWLRPVCH
jgi:hypothetical protein